jgi:hypothetical protein
MKRLKKAAGFALLLSLSLCLISTPALADNPWTEDPLQLQLGRDDSGGSPGPGRQTEGDIQSGPYRTSSPSFIRDVSYRVLLLMGFGDDLAGERQGWIEPVKGTESESRVNLGQKKD